MVNLNTKKIKKLEEEDKILPNIKQLKKSDIHFKAELAKLNKLITPIKVSKKLIKRKKLR